MNPSSLSSTTTEALLALRSQLEPYHTAPCGLKHEQLLTINDDNGVYFQRYGFCDKLVRKYRLGCAHTMANHRFCEIILSAAGKLPGAQALAQKFDDLFLNVYMMDLAKGVVEKQLQLALLADCKPLITGAKAAITEVTKTHHQLIKSIETLRSQLMDDLLCS